MVLHIYHAAVGDKEFQATEDIDTATPLTREVSIQQLTEKVSSTILEQLTGEDAVCCACKAAPATRLIHHTMVFAETSPPRIEDIPQPVCKLTNCAGVAKARYKMDVEEAGMLEGMPSLNGCFNCRKTNPPQGRLSLLCCGRCKVAKYCSEGCQREDWMWHKQVCSPAK